MDTFRIGRQCDRSNSSVSLGKREPVSKTNSLAINHYSKHKVKNSLYCLNNDRSRARDFVESE